MKRIGLLGGMSWESTALYYALINEGVRDRLGGLHSAECVMVSVDFADVERMQSAGDWAAAGAMLGREASRLESAGADFLVLCTNTMHKVADAIDGAVSIPLLHIGDVTAEAVLAAGIRKVGLLGTRFTMEEDFYVERLRSGGLDVVVPDAAGRAEGNRIIYDELVQGVVTEPSREAYRAIIRRLVAAGAEGIILGCTEIELLVGAGDSSVPVFPTTRLHARAAVEAALESVRTNAEPRD
jgi:aspartate racemase